MNRLDLYMSLKKKLSSLNIGYRESDLNELVNRLEIATEDQSKYIYVSDGWEDIEIKVSDILK